MRAGLLQDAQTLAGSNDIWIAGSLPKTGTPKLPLPIDTLTLGLSLQKDLLLDLTVNTGSVKTAQDLLHQLQQSQKSDLAKIGASMNLGAHDSTVRVRFAMNGDGLAQTLGDAMGQGLTPQFAALLNRAGTPAASSPVPLPPPTRKTAVIYGLEDGPREVPLESKP